MLNSLFNSTTKFQFQIFHLSFFCLNCGYLFYIYLLLVVKKLAYFYKSIFLMQHLYLLFIGLHLPTQVFGWLLRYDWVNHRIFKKVLYTNIWVKDSWKHWGTKAKWNWTFDISVETLGLLNLIPFILRGTSTSSGWQVCCSPSLQSSTNTPWIFKCKPHQSGWFPIN